MESENILPIDLPPEYLPFISTAQADQVAGSRYVVASTDAPMTRPAEATILWENDLWRLGRTADDKRFIEIFDVQTGGWHYVVAAEKDFSSGTLYPRRIPSRPSSIMPLHHPHDRALILGRLAHLHGGVVHSSCVAVDGKTMLFVGRSGAGKTTMARLWRQVGATIVNDERNIIRMDGDTVIAGSSPWHGEENQVSTLCAPLAGVFYLSQTPANRLKAVSCEDSVLRLFTTTFVPVFIEEGPEMILDSWSRILDKVPSYDLGFVPDSRVVPFCLAALGSRTTDAATTLASPKAATINP